MTIQSKRLGHIGISSRAEEITIKPHRILPVRLVMERNVCVELTLSF